MEREELVDILKSYWTDWDEWEGTAKDIEDLGVMPFIDNFSGFGWQEQDIIINTLTAIKNRVRDD